MSSTNRLIHEKSPYLLQHAHNPVDWYPWCDEAFQIAKTENKPIFLSVGYAACHWCHVMESESFEDQQAARELNDTFVCIKVDREERPDVDALYMTACQMITGSGGWPLTIFMTPERQPFFAATYLPKTSRYGRAGIIELSRQVRSLWHENPEAVHTSAEKITQQLRKAFDISMTKDTPDEKTISSAVAQIQRSFDTRYGGFDRAPKFPTAHRLQFLLHQYYHNPRKEILDMVTQTLTAMRYGGLWDHVGFGFHRYSTDERWLLPHFEKMLYDQALLAMVYLETYQVTQTPLFAQTAEEIFSYVDREMTATGGGFFAAEDADSDGEEGKFYLWTLAQWHEALGDSDANAWQTVMNITADGNSKEEATGQITGRNIVHLKHPIEHWIRRWQINEDQFHTQWSATRQRLFDYRKMRQAPLKDDKILTDWNGLMIAAYAMGARILGNERYEQVAATAADFIWTHLRSKNQQLLHRYREGQAAIAATANDYAFYILGLLELYRTTFILIYLERALTLQEEMIDHFWNQTTGGFYLTSQQEVDLPIRPVEIYDGATPSANSVALSNLIRLSRLTGDLRFDEMALRILQAFGNQIKAHPTAHTYFLMGVGFALGRSCEVVLVGNPNERVTQSLLNSLNQQFTPGLGVVLKTDENRTQLTQLAQFTNRFESENQLPTAYVCKGQQCDQPTTDLAEMLTIIQKQTP